MFKKEYGVQKDSVSFIPAREERGAFIVFETEQGKMSMPCSHLIRESADITNPQVGALTDKNDPSKVVFILYNASTSQMPAVLNE